MSRGEPPAGRLQPSVNRHGKALEQLSGQRWRGPPTRSIDRRGWCGWRRWLASNEPCFCRLRKRLL